jgi:UDP-N-acetyl-2-amino-2-deoxyglucuronate dehydrogenase
VDKLRRTGQPVEYVSIASPNYLHDAHIRFALRGGAHAICEKPLVLNPWNIDALVDIQREHGRRIYNILQLRLHPAIIELRERVQQKLAADPGKVYDLDLTYLTSRGRWYFISWKGDLSKSGGVATNIGVHFFDMLIWIFGPVRDSQVHLRQEDAVAGFLHLAHARVRWFLSVNEAYLPDEARARGQRTFRAITVDGEAFEFSEGFTELHTATYRHILDGPGFPLEEARPSIEIVHAIRAAQPLGMQGDYHPFVATVVRRS